jgi:hypothetical protein
MEVGGQLHGPAALPTKTPGSPWIGGFVGLGVGMGTVARKKESQLLTRIEPRYYSSP